MSVKSVCTLCTPNMAVIGAWGVGRCKVRSTGKYGQNRGFLPLKGDTINRSRWNSAWKRY